MRRPTTTWPRTRHPARPLSAGGQTPPAQEHAIAMLRDGLPPLYLHYLADHVQRLESHGKPELARAFHDWRARHLTA